MLNLNFYNTAKLSIICAILAATCFSVNDLSIKYLSDKYPLHEIILFRSLIGFCLTLFIIVPLEGGIKVLKKTSISNISKIASETSIEIMRKIINTEVNKSNVSAVVDEMIKKNMEKYT